MRKLKLFISLVLVSSLLCSLLAFPSRASLDSLGASLFDWLGSCIDKASGSITPEMVFPPLMLKKLYDQISDKLHPDCEHNWHTRGGPFGNGTKVVFTCTICGEQMEIDEDIYRAAYNSFVGDLPVTGYNSDGHLVWNPTLDDLLSDSRFEFYYNSPSSTYSSFALTAPALPVYGPWNPHSSLSHLYYTFTYDYSLRAIHVSMSLKSGVVRGDPFGPKGFHFYFNAPVAGTYEVLPFTLASWQFQYFDGSFFGSEYYYPPVSASASFDVTLFSLDDVYGGASDVAAGVMNISGDAGYEYDDGAASAISPYAVSSKFYYPGDTFSSNFVRFSVGDGDVAFGDFYLYFPSYEILPLGDIPGDTYNVNTRMSSVYGDVAYYDVDGNLQVSKSTTIVNEGDKTYYNPVTNNTYNVTNWNYDYSDRSYNLTTDTGDTTTITYGDEYITIREGDTVYNIYYYTDGAQLPETHTHDWYQTGQKRATCTDYGTKTYTCYTCGEQKTEVLPALGHAWLQRGYVDAEYDEEGELVEKAHVLYICSRCDEEYKDYDGVGPPDPPQQGEDPGDSSGLLAWLKDFKTWLGDKLDKLTGGGGDVIIDTDYNITYTDEDGEEHYTSIRDILDAFNWWKDVADIGRIFVEQVSANEAAAYAYAAGTGGNPPGAPSIPVNLGLAQSFYGVDYGGEVEMLDLSWYTPYKSTVDNLISGFLWLAFFWVLFRRAPSIISGAGLAVSKSEDIDEGHKGRRK